MENTIKLYKEVIIQIATPWGTGTGFYVKDYDLIVTNRHVVEGAIEVVISGKNLKKIISNVLYTDPVYDLAFLSVPEGTAFKDVKLCDGDAVHEGDKIIAMGHPYGLRFTATQGIISKAKRLWNGTDYIQVDAAINPGNSGGPLINENNEVVGVNTFIISDGVNLGFALPVNYLKETYNSYKEIGSQISTRCSACKNVIAKIDVQSDYCPNCGQKINENEFTGKPYLPSSAGKKIEEIITNLGYDVRITRVGFNFWEIEEGSALIKINYNKNTRYVLAWAVLCKLPKSNIAAIYEFLLKENYNLKGLSFSVMQQDIAITAMQVFDMDLNMETGTDLFKRLFKKSDDYDDVLIDMGAVPLTEEED